MVKGIFEIFDEVAKLKTNKAKAEALKQHDLFSVVEQSYKDVFIQTLNSYYLILSHLMVKQMELK